MIFFERNLNSKIMPRIRQKALRVTPERALGKCGTDKPFDNACDVNKRILVHAHHHEITNNKKNRGEGILLKSDVAEKN
ncbi:hypothetical protein Bhyg_13123 [Pseudolycoriella hygida]|uniref:Uncharacterized protein n=1 Tax=Pseudolycoriella hygida TaxID=35572 RepID=A0A9Q0MYU9_9DIPT|nr:hypothetical protein Bhyg_13123 [Pseudolycoriella hygida]